MIWTVVSFQTGSFFFCDTSPSFMGHFLIFWHSEMSQASVLSWLQPWNSHFSKEPWFILAEDSMKKLSLGTECANATGVLLLPLTEPGSGEFACTHACVHTLSVTWHVLFFAHLSIIKTTSLYTCLQFQSSTTDCISVFPFPNLLIPFSDSEGSFYPQCLHGLTQS